MVLIHANPEPWGHPTSIYGAEGRPLPPEHHEEMDRQFDALLAENSASGEVVSAETLADPASSTLYGWSPEGHLATKGPYPGANEQLAGFFIIDCVSRERAEVPALAWVAPYRYRPPPELRALHLSVVWSVLADRVMVMADRRTETQSVETAAAPDAVLALLADPRRIPDWAPAFADAVSGAAQSGWWARKDGQDFALRVPVNKEAGTVDYLREVAPGWEGGAYLRAVPRPGAGTVIVMTLPLRPDADPEEVAAALTAELTALAGLLVRTD